MLSLMYICSSDDDWRSSFGANFFKRFQFTFTFTCNIKVLAGTPIGTQNFAGPCISHIHFAVKKLKKNRLTEIFNKVADTFSGGNETLTASEKAAKAGFVDPTKYLEPRPIEIPKWVQVCDDYKLVILVWQSLINFLKKYEGSKTDPVLKIRNFDMILKMYGQNTGSVMKKRQLSLIWCQKLDIGVKDILILATSFGDSCNYYMCADICSSSSYLSVVWDISDRSTKPLEHLIAFRYPYK